MHKQKVLIFIFLSFCCASLKTFSQATVLPSSGIGCDPMTFTFTAPPGATSSNWNFSPGSGSGSPVYHQYGPGVYNITYSGIVGGSPVSNVITVTVFPAPTGSFSYTLPPSHCKPMTVNFAASNPPAGNTYTYTWTYGDSSPTPGSGITSSHSYNLAGNFTPILTITDSHGCNSQAITGGTFQVSTPPSMIISGNPGLSSCTSPFITSFSSNGSTSGSPNTSSLTYSWTFGNGSPSSTQQNPANITYTTGTYVVTLTGTDDNSCSSTISVPVSVTQPSVHATMPGTVCIDQPFTVTVQSNQGITIWNMGDGSTETFTLIPPSRTGTVHVYHTPGLQHISITVNSGACSSTFTTDVFVEQITPNFIGSQPLTTCSPTLVTTYTNQTISNTSGPLTYTWTTFWDPVAYNHATNTVVIGQNAGFTFYQNSLVPYTIYDPFAPTVSLFVRSPSGCTAFITHEYHTIKRPTAWFNKNKKEGCAPLIVSFRDTTFTDTQLYPITNYTWNNGATPPVLVTGVLTPPAPIPTQTFAYNSPGTYTPFLTIQTASGCIDVSFIDTVVVSIQPTLSATFNASVCAGQNFTINLSSTATPSNVQHWHAETDNGFFSGCVNNPNPVFPFSHVGVHSVTVSAYDRGCMGSTVVPQTITVKGPYGKFRFTTSCSARKIVVFDAFLQEVQTATLNFGDVSPTFTFNANANGLFSQNVTHTYAATGSYVATLTSIGAPGSLCSSHTFTMRVNVRDVQANMFHIVNPIPTSTGSAVFPVLPAPLVCVGIPINFTAQVTPEILTGCRRGYTWNLYSPITPTAIPPQDSDSPVYSRTFSDPGTYTLTLMVRDINDCIDTTTRNFRVSAANPSFTFNANPICLSDNPVQLFNTTTNNTLYPDPNINYKWNYGDLTPVFTTTSTSMHTHSYSNVPPPSVVFNVVLTSTNNFNCVASVTHTLQVNNPSAAFFPIPFKSVVCVPEALVFNALPGYATYSVNYSDSSAGPLITANSSFIHNFSISGTKTITLKVTDNSGCKNSSTFQVHAFVTPVPSFTTVAPANFCSPANITFTSTSTTTDPLNSPIVGYTWDVGAGPFATNLPSASNIYSTGTSTIYLTVSPSPGYCSATASLEIYVYDTKATLVLNKTKFCIGETITGHLTGTQDAATWICNVGFGIQALPAPAGATQNVSHTYTNPTQVGTETVIATVFSPNGSCKIATNPVPIEILKFNPEFKRNLELLPKDSIHCLGIKDQFSALLAGSSINYGWNFGDGSTSNLKEPSYTYSVAGVYIVTLTVSDQAVGCPGTATKKMFINPSPTAAITATNSCPNKPFIITGTGSEGVTSGTWSPAQNIIGSPNFTTTASAGQGTFMLNVTASVSTDFSLAVTDKNGCLSDTVFKNMYIQPLAHSVTWDTTVIVGEEIPIHTYQGPGFTYSWSPVITDLSCVRCHDPLSTTTVNITYTLLVGDELGCSEVTSIYRIKVDPKTSVDVPSAFTPNGDGVNDIIYADGWGIRSLKFFRIYNRWGQLLFETTDLKIGWNGYYAGIPQNMETYVFQVSAETYVDDKPIFKTGTFKLIR